MPAGWVYLEHPDITGGCQVPDDPDVIAAHEGRGWVVKPTPVELDPDAPNTGALPANEFLAGLAEEPEDVDRHLGSLLADEDDEDPPPDPPGDAAAPPTRGPRANKAGAPSASPSTTDPASADDQNKE